MTIDEYRSKKQGQTVVGRNKYLRGLVKRTMMCFAFVILVLLISMANETCRNYIKKYLLETNFEFSKISGIYNKYIGKLTDDDIEVVSSNQLLEYTKEEKYIDGVKLTVSENYNVNLLESGIVVFIGEKEGYGNTIIVQQSNGIDAWYGNIQNSNVKIYDYIEKGTIIGNANNILYLVFQKNGENLNYEDYIK